MHFTEFDFIEPLNIKLMNVYLERCGAPSTVRRVTTDENVCEFLHVP